VPTNTGVPPKISGSLWTTGVLLLIKISCIGELAQVVLAIYRVSRDKDKRIKDKGGTGKDKG
jgi:hypothetical protein